MFTAVTRSAISDAATGSVQPTFLIQSNHAVHPAFKMAAVSIGDIAGPFSSRPG